MIGLAEADSMIALQTFSSKFDVAGHGGPGVTWLCLLLTLLPFLTP